MVLQGFCFASSESHTGQQNQDHMCAQLFENIKIYAGR